MSPAVLSPGFSILLADDDLQLATFLSKSLETEGYAVHTAPDESSVVEELKRQNYQLIMLDLNFGQTDGLALLGRLRGEGVATPVMVLSARNHLADRIRSFELGADDYVTKPFSFQELAARASALLRRKADPSLRILRVDDLELDPATRKVHRGSREMRLSPKELDMLALLMRRNGDTVTRQELLRECWGQDLETDSNLVDVYVNYLRKKVDGPNEEKLIHTVRGSGYRIGKLPTKTKAAAASPGGWTQVAADAYVGEQPTYPQASSPETPVKSMVHSMTHDLAQPLTSLRCFLETLPIGQKLTEPQIAELKLVEQQADRAIVLAKSISLLVREAPMPKQPTVSLHALLNEIFDDLRVLLQSGLLVVERNWETNLQVTSNPVLRDFFILLISKLIGRNSRPLVLTITADTSKDRCSIRLHWKAHDNTDKPTVDARTVLARDGESMRQLASQLDAEFSFEPSQHEVTLSLPWPASAPPSVTHRIH